MGLTKLQIDKVNYSAKTSQSDWFILWDSGLKGFGLRIYPSGRKVFVISYRCGGRKHLMTIGPYGLLTLDQARDRARKKLVEVLDGGDPISSRRKNDTAATVEHLCAQFMTKYAIGPNPDRPIKKSYLEDQRRIDKHILKAWKNHKVKNIQHSDVRNLRHKIGEYSIYEANRTMALVSVMWEFARAEGIIERTADNPARGIEKYKENKRTRWITPEEMPKLFAAINAYPNIYAVAAFKLFLLTGCRKSELMSADWSYVDFQNKQLNIPGDKTKSKKALHLPLSSAAMSILASLPREVGNPYIFPGKIKGQHLVGTYKVWDTIRKEAGLPDIRIHDLRHTVGSWLKQSGNDSFLIQQILNHSSSNTTSLYTHFAQDHLRAPLERHSDMIMQLVSN